MLKCLMWDEDSCEVFEGKIKFVESFFRVMCSYLVYLWENVEFERNVWYF